MNRKMRLFQHYLRRLFHLAVTRSKLVLGLMFVIFLIAVVQMDKLRLSLNTRDLVGRRDPSGLKLHEFYEYFPQNSKLYLRLFDPGRNLPSESLASVESQLRQIYEENPIIENVFSALDLRRAMITEDHRTFYPKVLDLKTAGEPLTQLKNSYWSRLLTDPQGRDLLIEFTLRDADPPGPFGTVDPFAIERIMDSTEKSLPFQKQWTGAGAFFVYSHFGMQRAQWLNLAVLVLLIGFMRLAFGSWKAGFLFALTLIFTNAIIHGGMAAAGIPLNPLTVSIFILMAVATLSDFLFSCQAQLEEGVSATMALRPLLLPSFFTSLTTAVGFGSLLVSEVETLRTFGFWTAIGAMVEWCAIYVMLPALASLFPRLRFWTFAPHAFAKNFVPRLLEKSIPRWLGIALFALVIPAALLIGKVRLSFSILDLLPKNHVLQTATHELRERRGWESEVSVVFTDPKGKAGKLEALFQHPFVAAHEDMDGFAADVAGKSGDRLDRAMVRRELENSPAASRLLSKTGVERVILYVQSTDVAPLMEFEKFVGNLCSDGTCFLSGDLMAYADFSRRVLSTLYESLFTSIFLVGLLLAAIAGRRRLKIVLPLLLSSFWAPVVVLAILPLTGIQVDLVTVVALSMLVGLTGDNGIQFLFGSSGEDLTPGIRRRGQASIVCHLMMAGASLVFVFSYFQPPRILGLLLALGLVAALIGDVWLLKFLLGDGRKNGNPESPA